MIAFAEHQFRLDSKGDDGRSKRDHLEAAARQGIQSAADELEGPPLPLEVGHVWGWFGELSRGRQSGFAANPIAWSEIESWSRVTGARPTFFELRLLCELDALLLGVVREGGKK